MEDHIINKEIISKFISEKLNENINIIKIEKIGHGYHSDGFKLTANNNKNYFLKKVKSHDLGFELPERKVSSLLTGHEMAKRVNKSPLPIGITLINKNNSGILPDLNEETEIYHIQELETNGKNYWDMIKEKENKKIIDKEDIEEINKVVDYISHVHSIKHPSKDVERLKSVYNDSLRSILSHPELTFMLLHDFKEDHEFFPRSLQKEYIGLMYDLVHKYKDKYERLSALHGDFWGANFFFKVNKDTWVIDYSRIPLGDPGEDIGLWFSQYWARYQMTNNNYFKELGELFLKTYEIKTGNKEIRKHISVVLGLMALINITPRFYPNLDPKIGKKIIENTLEILKNGELKWN